MSSVVSLICGTQPRGLGANFGRSARCQICTSYEMETTTHVLFDCDTLNITLDNLLRSLLTAMPDRMRCEYEAIDISSRLKFLLSGFLVENYVPEWQEIYLKTSSFIYELYRDRRNHYELLDIAPDDDYIKIEVTQCI